MNYNWKRRKTCYNQSKIK